jgi:hypothetical protein
VYFPGWISVPQFAGRGCRDSWDCWAVRIPGAEGIVQAVWLLTLLPCRKQRTCVNGALETARVLQTKFDWSEDKVREATQDIS